MKHSKKYPYYSYEKERKKNLFLSGLIIFLGGLLLGALVAHFLHHL